MNILFNVLLYQDKVFATFSSMLWISAFLRSPRADMVLRFINPSGQIILNRSDDLLIRPDRLVVAGCLLTGYLC